MAHQNKLKINKRTSIYNFHLGNLQNQRGSFIFFYKFKYFWKDIDLTFHQMSKGFDKGLVINKKKINCRDYDAIEILNLYKKNVPFIIKSIELCLKKKNFIIMKI